MGAFRGAGSETIRQRFRFDPGAAAPALREEGEAGKPGEGGRGGGGLHDSALRHTHMMRFPCDVRHPAVQTRLFPSHGTFIRVATSLWPR